jgi:hypothetical protein
MTLMPRLFSELMKKHSDLAIRHLNKQPLCKEDLLIQVLEDPLQNNRKTRLTLDLWLDLSETNSHKKTLTLHLH